MALRRRNGYAGGAGFRAIYTEGEPCKSKKKLNGDVDLRYFADKTIRSSKVVTPARRDVEITLGHSMSALSFQPQYPKKIDATLHGLIKYFGLSPDDANHLKFTRPSTFEPEANFCHFNIWLQIRFAGGAPQPGWILAQDKRRSFAEAIFHTVWRSPDSNLIDFTPREDSEKRVLFVPDFTRSITLTSHEGRPAIHTFDNIRVLGRSLMTPLTEITTVMEGDFPQRHGLWPW